MKKFISAILSAVIFMSFITPALATGDGELEALVKSVKGRVDIPSHYTDFHSEKYALENGDVNYYLQWTSKENTSENIGVLISSRGDIIEFHRYMSHEDYDKKGVASFAAKDYADKAAAFVKRANPNFSKELRFDITPDIGSVHSPVVYVKFPREIGGIPVATDVVTVNLNKYTGEVMSQNVSWSYMKNIPDSQEIIDAVSAVEKFGELSGMNLQYITYGDSKEARLVYMPNSRDIMIDAITGERFEIAHRDYGFKEESDAMQDSVAGSVNNRVELTEEELASIEELKSLLSENRLSEIIKAMANTTIQSCEITEISYDRYKISDDEHKYYANVTLRGRDSKYASARLDAVTGEIISFYAYENIDGKRNKTQSADAMRTSAERFIATCAPDIATRVRDFSDVSSGGYFRYSRCENDVEYGRDGISITVSEYTGKIVSYSRSWDEGVTFESADGILTSDEALKMLFEKYPIKLMYVPCEMGYANPNVCDNAALIYMLDRDAAPYISAKDGAPLGYNLEKPENEKDKYVLQDDVKNHFSATAVKTLAENGIIVSDAESFKPDEVILQKEAILLLEKLNGGYINPLGADYEELMRSAIGRGILIDREVSPEAAVLRENAACYIVRALGYGKAAEIRGIYNVQFKDAKNISDSRVGYVAIARGLGIVNGDKKGMFNPKSGVTRGEFSVMLCNALMGAK